MKKYFFSMVVLLVLSAIVFGVGYVMYDRGDNKVFEQVLEYTDKEYTAESDVEKVDVSLIGDYNVILQRGENSSLNYSQSEISDITVTEEEGVLTLREKVGWKKVVKNWYRKRKKTDLIITLPEDKIPSIRCFFSGEGKFDLPDGEYGDLEFVITGKADVSSTAIKAKDVSINVSGFGRVNLAGEFQNVQIQCSGMTETNVNGSANIVDIKASGNLNLYSENLICPQIDVKTSGVSRLNLAGEGSKLSAKVTGYCKVEAKDFLLNTLNIDASGNANMIVNVQEEIIAYASGNIKVEYYGEPAIKHSGSGNIKFSNLN